MTFTRSACQIVYIEKEMTVAENTILIGCQIHQCRVEIRPGVVLKLLDGCVFTGNQVELGEGAEVRSGDIVVYPAPGPIRKGVVLELLGNSFCWNYVRRLIGRGRGAE